VIGQLMELVMHRVGVGVRIRVTVRLGIGLGLGFRSGQSQCVPPFRSVPEITPAR